MRELNYDEVLALELGTEVIYKSDGQDYVGVIMSPQKLIAVRDPQGFRPLCMGKLGDDIVFASESCALDICGATFVRDIEPGEVVVVKDKKIESIKQNSEKKKGMCIFEYIYFARPDSILEGLCVHEFREQAGRHLAMQAPVEADIVAAVPDSGIDAALRIFKTVKNSL
jgi:amidophosphoribosyltransferase